MSRRYIPPHFNRHPKTYTEDLPRQAAISPANPVALHSGIQSPSRLALNTQLRRATTSSSDMRIPRSPSETLSAPSTWAKNKLVRRLTSMTGHEVLAYMLGKFLVHNRLHAIATTSSRVQCGPPRRSDARPRCGLP